MESQITRKWSFLESPWFWAAATVLLYLSIRLLSGFDGLYGQDSYAYLDQARKLQVWMADGTHPGKFFWTRNFPLLGALWPFAGLGHWMQFLSFSGMALTVAGTIGMARNLGMRSKWLGPIVFVLLALSPFFLRNSMSIMSDSLSIGLMTAGIWAGQSALKTDRLSGLLLGAFLLGAAVWMRNPLLLLVFPTMLYWGIKCIQEKRFIHILGMFALFFLTALPELLILPAKDGNAYLNSINHSYLQDWSVLNFFRRDFVEAEGHQVYKLPNILALTGVIWHLGYWGIGVIGIGFRFLGRKVIHTKVNWLLLAGPICYCLLLAGIPFQNNRFLLALLPFVALWLVGGWIWLLEKVQFKYAALIWATFFVLNLAFAAFINLKILDLSKTEAKIATQLEAFVAPNENLYEFGMGSMLDGREVPVHHITMFDSLEIPAKKGDWVLFNLGMNTEVWKDEWPMKNWRDFETKFDMNAVQEWKGGWKLYELQ